MPSAEQYGQNINTLLSSFLPLPSPWLSERPCSSILPWQKGSSLSAVTRACLYLLASQVTAELSTFQELASAVSLALMWCAAMQALETVKDRLLDIDDKVRSAACISICKAAAADIKVGFLSISSAVCACAYITLL